MFYTRWSVALCAVLLLPAGSAWAGSRTVTLEPVKDNTLYDDGGGVTSNGMGSFFFAGRNFEGQRRRGVVAFDLNGAIPAGATVTQVTLTLHMSMTINGDQPMGLHRVLADWGEGESDAQGGEGGGSNATPGDATWFNTFFPDDLWTTPGGDFDPAPHATTTVGGDGFYTWGSTPELVADVQVWVDGSTDNFGWLLLGNEKTFPSTKRFDSRENSDPAQRPMLTVVFDDAGGCAADVNGDGVVDTVDLTAVIVDWGVEDSPADVNGDGVVDVVDLVTVLLEWGPC